MSTTNKFKVGDKVQRKNGQCFSNGESVVTISPKTLDGNLWLHETDTYIEAHRLELAEVTESPAHLITLDDIVPDGYMAVDFRAPNKGDMYFAGSVHTAMMKFVDTQCIIVEPIKSPMQLQREARLVEIESEIAKLDAEWLLNTKHVRKLQEERLCLTRNS